MATPYIPSSISAQQLRLLIERIENLEHEKAQIAEQVREVFAEAKIEGFDPKTMRQIIRLRKMKKEDAVEQEELLDLYKQALGMIPSESPSQNYDVDAA